MSTTDEVEKFFERGKTQAIFKIILYTYSSASFGVAVMKW